MPASCSYCGGCQLKSRIWQRLLYNFFRARAPDAGFARYALHQNLASSLSAADPIGCWWLGLAAGGLLVARCSPIVETRPEPRLDIRIWSHVVRGKI